MLKEATEIINNPNLVSAYYDNAGGWAFYEGLVLAISIETHNSPTGKEPFGGQITKLLGNLRDIFEFALGAKPIGTKCRDRMLAGVPVSQAQPEG